MRITVLIDDLTQDGLQKEWGLSLFIQHEGLSYLLDTGGSDLYAANAQALGIDLTKVDHAILSHAHSDHAGGLPGFLAMNSKAPVHLNRACGEDCYFKLGCIRAYVGLPRGMRDKHADRLHASCQLEQLADSVYLVGHGPEDLSAIGKKKHMYRKTEGRFVPDDFRHEQSLVFDTPRGLVVLNSCSHAGAERILTEVEHALPGRPIHGYLGGLHLKGAPKSEVLQTAEAFRKHGVQRIYTGHCTGQKAYDILRAQLGPAIAQFRAGMVIDL